jgi:hypothetical protein
MNNHQNAIFHQLDNFIKHSYSFANIRKITNQARLLIINSFIMQIKDLTGYNMTEKSIGRLGW